MKKNIIIACSLLIVSLTTTAQKLSPNTRIALAEASQGIATKSIVKSNETIETFIHLNSPTAIDRIKALGGSIRSIVGDDIVTASVPLSSLTALAESDEVKYVQAASEARLLMDNARADANVNACHTGVDDKGTFTGKGVVVGIVDQGFEYAHTDFMTSDGTETRVKRIWDQNSTVGNSPSGYDYGTEYTNFDEMKAAKYDLTSSFHATHVTGIAAGADKGTSYYGVAPDADLVLVSFANANTNIVDGIKYCFDYAESVGKPCVVNISLGSHAGPHDGTSSTDLSFAQLVGPGRIIVGAAGNEGSQNLHASKTFTDTDTQMKVMFGFPNTQSSSKTTYVDMWSSVGSDISVKAVVVDALRGRVLAESPTISGTGTLQTTKYTFPEGNDVTCTVQMEAVVDPLNNRTEVFLMGRVTSIADNRKVGLVVTGASGTTVHMWNNATNGYFLDTNLNGWTSGDNACTVGELGGTAKDVITVGSYNTKDRYTTLGGETYDINTTLVGETNGISLFSSHGPTADGRMKPDVTAPGCAIVSATSLYYVSFSSSYAAAKSGSDYYDVNYGTSMASPFVTGTVALWLQANPTLRPEDVRNIILSSSRHDDYTGEASTTNYTWGAGKIDALEGLRQALVYTGIEETTVTDQLLSIETDRAARSATFRFAEGSAQAHAVVYNAMGQQVASAPISVSGQTLDLSSLGEGIYIVTLKNGEHTKTVKTLF